MGTEKNLEKVTYMRTFMKEHPSIYTYKDDMQFEKKYRLVNYENKELAMINGEVNTVSDCFIVYAITMLGCADISTIANFLNILKKSEPQLRIPEFDKDLLKSRLAVLKKNGFLFNILYTIPVQEEPVQDSIFKTDLKPSTCSLYTAAKDAVSIMNSKLRKQVKPNPYLEHKPIDELIGLAASSATVVRLATNNPNFIKQDQGIFKGKFSGTNWLDAEFTSKVGDETYKIGIVSIYLHKHPEYLTEADYVNIINYKLNVIRDYLINRSKKHNAKVILVCESNDDMVRFSKSIYNSGAFEEDMLKNIHFTSYGLIDGYGKGTGDWFLNMLPDESSKNGFSYEVSPQFI